MVHPHQPDQSSPGDSLLRCPLGELRDHGDCDLMLALVQDEIQTDQRGHPLAQVKVPPRTQQNYALSVAAAKLVFGGLRVRMKRRRQGEDPPSA